MAEMTSIERIQAAIRCEKPDRVPIVPMIGFFCARYKGIKIENYINDWDAVYASTSVTEFAFALTLPMRLRLPGRELPSDTLWQFDEVPIIEIKDYDFAIYL